MKLRSLIQPLPFLRQHHCVFIFQIVNIVLAALSGVYWGMEERWSGCGAWFAMSVFITFIALMLAIMKRSWRRGILQVNAGIFIGIMVNIVSFWIGQALHWMAIRQSVEAGESIVRAIERYKRDHGNFPTSLNALVPNYLPTIPKPMFGFSQFQYELAYDKVTWNAWGGYQIFVEVGESFMNPDYLCYRPSRRYPKNTVRIGDWAKLYDGWNRKEDWVGRPITPKFIPKLFGARYD